MQTNNKQCVHNTNALPIALIHYKITRGVGIYMDNNALIIAALSYSKGKLHLPKVLTNYII